MAAEVEASQKTVLYNTYISSCSFRIRIVLNYKGIEYEYRAPKTSHSPGYTPEELEKLNLKGQVPVLLIDGLVLSESVAILEYLEETRPQHSLLPSSPKERAIVRKFVERINAGIQPLQNSAVLDELQKEWGGGEERLGWAHFWIDRGLKALERDVTQTSGKYCLGDNVTLADVFLVPQLLNAERFKLDLSKYPTLNRVKTNLNLLPAFQKAHPFKQIDAVDTVSS